jgi:hypothetical protein
VPKVTMVLTEKDAENADRIYATSNARSKAHAVGIALGVTRYIVDALLHGAKLYLQYPSGEKDHIVVPGISVSPPPATKSRARVA